MAANVLSHDTAVMREEAMLLLLRGVVVLAPSQRCQASRRHRRRREQSPGRCETGVRCIGRVAAIAWGWSSTRFGVAWLLSKCRRRDGVTPTQDDREDVNAVFMDKYPKAILIESGIALVILALAKAGVGPLGEKFREEGD